MLKKAEALSKIANIPEIAAQAALIHQILSTDYVEQADINELEHIRNSLRGLIKYIPKDEAVRYHTNFEEENMLWSEVGTKDEYEAEYGSKPLGEFVREIVGLDMNAAKEAFAEYLNSANLDSRQIYFVNQIVEYIVHNGLLKDFSILQEPPFTDQGSIVDIFTDMSVWLGIKNTLDQVNSNAIFTAA